MRKLPTPTADYDIGYKKPPKATQFKKGASGNPKGRPKGGVNLATTVRRVFERKVTIQQDGRTRKVSLAEAMLIRLMSKAVAGDTAATRLSIGLLQATDASAGPAQTLFESEDDRALLRKALGEWNSDSSPDAEPQKPRPSPNRKGGRDDEKL